MPEEMQDRSYREIEESGAFQKPDPNPVARREKEGRRAVEIAHSCDLDRVAALLKGGQSVLIECDKILTEPLHSGLKDPSRLPAMKWEQVTFNAEQPNAPDSVMAQLLKSFATRLKAANAAPGCAAVARHLDLMMCTSDNRPRMELNDILYWLLEFPNVAKLVFWGPLFPVQKVVESAFPNRLQLQGFDRGILWRLLTHSEAKKFCADCEQFTVAAQSTLYQYVSGSNVVEVRRILRGLDPLLPAHAPDTSGVYDYIRRQTGLAPMVRGGEVAGYDSLREQLERVVIFPTGLRRQARNERELMRADALMPRGIILYGPPGSGKTEWAKWLASRLGTPLFIIHGPELKNKFVGETEAAIRRIFAQARRAAPSIILIDEIDAMTPSRSGNESNFEASMVAQLLTEMDGLRREESVIVVGTTNRLDSVDPAFLRPGRFHRPILVPYPGPDDRAAIIAHYDRMFDLGLTQGSIDYVARITGGFVDEQRRRELMQYRDAYIDSAVPPGLRGSGPELERRISRQLGIADAPQFSGDHLRAICLWLLGEWLFRGEPEGLMNSPAFLDEAVAFARGGETAEPVPELHPGWVVNPRF